jgi:hypothetical protein
VSPSSNSASNCEPSRWNSVPSLKTLPKVSCTVVMLSADADLAAELVLDVGRARQVVGMDMGLDQPLKLQAVGLDVLDHRSALS